MSIDVKELIEKAVKAITEDDKLKKLFEDDPVKALEKILGVDLPDDIVEKLIDGVKAKISIDKVSDALGALKKLF